MWAVGAALRVVAPCPSAVALIFTGSLQNTDDTTTLVTNVDISYWNVLTPSLVTTSTVPVSATLPPNNIYIPVAVALNTSVPAGTYMVQVNVTGESGVSVTPVVVNASGTLNALVARSGGPTCV